MANAIRALAMDAVEKANSGHPGLPMGAADIATVLFTRFLKYDPADPQWPDRDRFVLSAGHGSMLLYALLYLTGYEAVTIDDAKLVGKFTRNPVEVTFDQKHNRQRATYWARWASRRGEVGPWSLPVAMTIAA